MGGACCKGNPYVVDAAAGCSEVLRVRKVDTKECASWSEHPELPVIKLRRGEEIAELFVAAHWRDAAAGGRATGKSQEIVPLEVEGDEAEGAEPLGRGKLRLVLLEDIDSTPKKSPKDHDHSGNEATTSTRASPSNYIEERTFVFGAAPPSSQASYKYRHLFRQQEAFLKAQPTDALLKLEYCGPSMRIEVLSVQVKYTSRMKKQTTSKGAIKQGLEKLALVEEDSDDQVEYKEVVM
ncbi:unnamed protein product [Amoebophrya sp. A25]|nr:unnamed protein product [Amoebophrya sp. A25]|eukprot:GSA25T00013209001.1